MNPMFFRNVLVLSPHTDDGELAAGGTINRLREAGINVTYLALSAPRSELRNECRKCLEILGVEDYKILDFPRRVFPKNRQDILQFLYDYNDSHEIDLVFTPSTMDLHQDHETVTSEALRAFKHSTILGYELPWNHIIFHENGFVTLDARHMKKKISALMQYKTQQKKHYFDPDYLEGILRSRGAQIGVKYAEAFEVIKLVLNIRK